ncbi:rolling circle replication-associated protein [Sporosarcina sp. FSL K6-5500]|uniref:rolling circle replication-associated protein n=1 Tax=Sporosarcina sp. FSL K6-5500 TaxID=2921558 RepID=UPI0030F79380
MVQKQTAQIYIANSAIVTVTDMGHILEMQHMEKQNNKVHIQKIDKNRYVHLATGEIHQFKLSENRGDNENSLRQTFKRMRFLINKNFKGNPNELHITMTYAENMTDTKRLYVDFDKFMKRLRYKYKGRSTIDYMNVVEPQQRGAWHIHMLIRFNDLDNVFISNEELRNMWGQGFVTIKSLKNNTNIGAYLSAYLADIEVPEGYEVKGQKEVMVKQVDGKDKRFIKGGRLWMYPPGMNLFRKSKGIVYPERKKMTYKNLKKIVGSVKPHFQKQYKVEKESFKNTITQVQYNLKR